MSWRLARSLGQLQRDLDARFPGRVTPDWTIGDAAHAGRGSDHNPNLSGVVCAIDVRGEATARALWDHILRERPERVKYAIFQRQIISSTVSPWTVRHYSGSNPHNDHIHVSVGRGPDGNSGRPDLYDSTAPWWGSPSSAPKDWFDMADKSDLRDVMTDVMRAEMARIVVAGSDRTWWQQMRALYGHVAKTRRRAEQIPDGDNVFLRVINALDWWHARNESGQEQDLEGIAQFVADAVSADVSAVLSELTPEAIAAAIPDDLAGQVADELSARLAG